MLDRHSPSFNIIISRFMWLAALLFLLLFLFILGPVKSARAEEIDQDRPKTALNKIDTVFDAKVSDLIAGQLNRLHKVDPEDLRALQEQLLAAARENPRLQQAFKYIQENYPQYADRLPVWDIDPLPADDPGQNSGKQNPDPSPDNDSGQDSQNNQSDQDGNSDQDEPAGPDNQDDQDNGNDQGSQDNNRANTQNDNLILNPSLENADGQLPAGWFTGNWGNNAPTFTYPASGHQSASAIRVDMGAYTDGDAKWYFADVPVIAGEEYIFSDYYRSDTSSNITIRYAYPDGSYSYNGLNDLPASPDWQAYQASFTIPANAISLTIFHLLNSPGYLATDAYHLSQASANEEPEPDNAGFGQGLVSLTFDDSWASQYQTAFPALEAKGFKATFYIETVDALDPYSPLFFHSDDILDLEAHGHEIGAHTRNHAHLTQLDAAGLAYEIQGSVVDLLGIGVNEVASFAYPYGEYDQNVINAVQAAGLASARGVERGFNFPDSDPYTLKIQEMNKNTSFDQVKAWIDRANADNSWLILMFHHIDNQGDYYSTTPELFRAISDYLAEQPVEVLTVKQAMARMD